MKKIIAVLMLLFAIGCNLFLYRAEPTAMVDPNDNSFQYGLVERTNQIWDWANQNCKEKNKSVIPVLRSLGEGGCHLSFLVDHWVPNWAEGYNLPYYYSHVPQIIIVGSYRVLTGISQFLVSIFNFQFSIFNLFQYYHYVIYLLLCLFPLSIFIALRILNLPLRPSEVRGKQSESRDEGGWLTSGVGALLASHISTDGLYGLDPSSFLWRGWGLSSQLFAMIWMPLALAYAIRCINFQLSIFNYQLKKNARRDYLLAILFITLTTAAHMGLGLMLFISLPVIALTPAILTFLNQGSLKVVLAQVMEGIGKTLLLALPPLLILSYWLVPMVMGSALRNASFWDPIWKFDSYGAKEVLVNFFNGWLFDWGRLPVMTGLVVVGFFICLWRTCEEKARDAPLPFLFLFFLLLYFGNTTWGGLLNLIPGMSEFHQHRFLVGVHLIGLFVAPIGFMWLVNKIVDAIRSFSQFSFQILSLCLTVVFSFCLVSLLFPQTLSYGQYNQTLIQQANTAFSAQQKDAEKLLQTLTSLPPGRIYAGRGGSWGKDFKIAETPWYMYLSANGLPTVLWLPETWSLNSDTEQYFSEDVPDHYSLYNIRYIVAPISQSPQPFWTLIKKTPSWKLYEVKPSAFSYQSSAVIPPSSAVIPAKAGIHVKKPWIPDPNFAYRLRGARQVGDDNTFGSITAGISPTIVFSDKHSFANLVKLWIQSEYPEKDIFPELRLTHKKLASQGDALRSYIQLPRFTMVDEATYLTPDGKTHSLFAEPPVYISPISPNLLDQPNPTTSPPRLPITILSQSNDADMVFRATVVVAPREPSPSTDTRFTTNDKRSCPTCVVVLKHTYHTNWRVHVIKHPSNQLATDSSSLPSPIDQRSTTNDQRSISVFPSFTAVRLEEPGTYEVTFSYEPSPLKKILLSVGILLFVILIAVFCHPNRSILSSQT